jgi:hypothetical protein
LEIAEEFNAIVEATIPSEDERRRVVRLSLEVRFSSSMEGAVNNRGAALDVKTMPIRTIQ